MRLIFNAFALYCLGIYTEICMKLLNLRVERLLEKNASLGDKLTIAMSNICWHFRVKLKLAEAEFNLKCLRLTNPPTHEAS